MRGSIPHRGRDNPRAPRTPKPANTVAAAMRMSGTTPANPGVFAGSEATSEIARIRAAAGSVEGATPLTGLKGTTSRPVVDATLAAGRSAQNTPGGINPLSRTKLPVDDCRK